MSKRSRQTSQSTSREVATPTHPDWSTRAVQSVTDRVFDLGRLNHFDLVAPASPLEVEAGRRAASLGGWDAGFAAADATAQGANGYGWLYDGAADLARGVAGRTAPQMQAASLLDGLDRYVNPYRTQVLDAAMGDFDADVGRTRATQTLAMAREQAFGGSGAALTRSQTEGELARARSARQAELLNQMFNTSTALAGQDADRRQQASATNAQLQADQLSRQLQVAGQLGQFANENANRQLQLAGALGESAQARADNARADVATQAQVGGILRGIDQASRQAPLDLVKAQVDMLSGLPLEMFGGRITEGSKSEQHTTRETGASLGEIAQLIGAVRR